MNATQVHTAITTHRLVAFDYIPAHGGWNLTPREVFRGPEHLCERYCQHLRKLQAVALAQPGVALTSTMYFVHPAKGQHA
jgi:hypothetical protein